MEIVKEEIICRLKETDRVGMDNLIEFLCSSDFFTAPASTKYHLAYPGGLARHSLNVTLCAIALNATYDSIFSRREVTIAAMLHDLCKINYYKEIDEPPTKPQANYLQSLMGNVGLKVPAKMNKAYAGVLIDFMLKSYNNDNRIPPYVRNYIVEDTLPIGHGEKSLYFASKFVTLNTDEVLAIRWHMGAWDLGDSVYQKYAYNDAIKESQLISILQIADMEATYLVEVSDET